MKTKIMYEVQSFSSKFKSDHGKQDSKKTFYMSSVFVLKKDSYIKPQFQYDIIATLFPLPYFLDSTLGLLILISSVRIKASICYLGFLANFQL